jgi:hypothetical protein
LYKSSRLGRGKMLSLPVKNRHGELSNVWGDESA